MIVTDSMRKEYGDRLPAMLEKRAEMTEEERNTHLIEWYGGTLENKALRKTVLKSFVNQFDVAELKFCTCKSCGQVTSIPIYDLEYCSLKKMNGVDTMGKPKFKEQMQVLGYDRLNCDCCADGEKSIDNAKTIVALLVTNNFSSDYERIINNQKSNAVIPAEFRKYTFQNWNVAGDGNIKKLADGYADRVVKGSTRKILISELKDSGATYVGISILNKIAVGGMSVRYIDYVELSDKLFNEEYKKYLADCEKADVIMVAGITKSNDRVMQRIVDLMQNSVLIFTTSEKGSELKNKIGEKYFSILFTDYELIKITSDINAEYNEVAQ